MATQTNLAYDLSVYEPKHNQPQRQPKPKLSVKKNKKVHSVSAAKSLFAGIAVTFMLCAVLYGKVETTKLYNDISYQKEQLKEIQSDNAQLQSQIESNIALQNIEGYAENNLGLVKLDKGRIEYIQLESDNVTKVVSDEKEGIMDKVKGWFSGVLEYIGV